MREFREVRKRYGGNKEEAQKLTSLARLVLGELKNDLSFNNLSQGQRQRALPDGSIITVESYFDLDVVSIFVPEEPSLEFGLANLFEFARISERYFDQQLPVNTKSRYFIARRRGENIIYNAETDNNADRVFRPEIYYLREQDNVIPDDTLLVFEPHILTNYINSDYEKILYGYSTYNKRYKTGANKWTLNTSLSFQGETYNDVANWYDINLPNMGDLASARGSSPESVSVTYSYGYEVKFVGFPDAIELERGSNNTRRTNRISSPSGIAILNPHLITIEGKEFYIYFDLYEPLLYLLDKEDQTKEYQFNVPQPAGSNLSDATTTLPEPWFSFRHDGKRACAILYESFFFIKDGSALIAEDDLGSAIQFVQWDIPILCEWEFQYSLNSSSVPQVSINIIDTQTAGVSGKFFLAADYSYEDNETLGDRRELYYELYIQDPDPEDGYKGQTFRTDLIWESQENGIYRNLSVYLGLYLTNVTNGIRSTIEDLDLRYDSFILLIVDFFNNINGRKIKIFNDEFYSGYDFGNLNQYVQDWIASYPQFDVALFKRPANEYVVAAYLPYGLTEGTFDNFISLHPTGSYMLHTLPTQALNTSSPAETQISVQFPNDGALVNTSHDRIITNLGYDPNHVSIQNDNGNIIPQEFSLLSTQYWTWIK